MAKDIKEVPDHKIQRNKTIALSNIERSRVSKEETLEWECRFAARHLGKDEEAWEDLVPLMIAIEEGRLFANAAYIPTQQEIDDWRNYMSNR